MLSVNTGRTEADHAPLSALQWRIVTVVGLAIVLEGIDIQVLGFTTPAILNEWHLTQSSFGTAMAASLFGMAIGAPIGGRLGDRLGRRSMLLTGVGLFGAFTLLTSLVESVSSIAALRVLAGLCFGAVLSNAPVLAAEWLPMRRRHQVVALVIIGTPTGGMIGAAAASWIVPHLGWRAAFAGGGVLPLVLVVAMYFSVPESPGFTAQRSSNQLRSPFSAIISPEYLRSTMGVGLAFCANLAINYAFFNWAPTMLVQAGLPLQPAIRGLLWFNLAGATAAAITVTGLQRVSMRTVLLVLAALGLASALLLASALRGLDSVSTASLPLLVSVSLALEGVAAVASQALLYALAVHVYPTACRTTGLGVAGGIGRCGAIVSAFFGGQMLSLSGGPSAFVTAVGALFVVNAIGIVLVNRYSGAEPATT